VPADKRDDDGFFLPWLALGQTIDLSSALEAALAYDQDLQISSIDLLIANNRIAESNQSLYPRVYAGVNRSNSHTYTTGVPGGSVGSQTFPMLGNSLGISQTIFSPNLTSQREASRKNYIGSEWLHQKAIKDVHFKVIKTYVELAFFQEALLSSQETYQELLKIQSKTKESAKKVEDESQKIIRLYQDIDINRFYQIISEYSGQIRIRKNQLTSMTGQQFEKVAQLSCLQSSEPIQPIEIERDRKFDPEKNIDFIITQSNIDAVAAEKSSFKLPSDFSIDFSASYNLSICIPLYPSAWVNGITYGFQANLPLNNLFGKSAREQSIDLRIERNKAELESIKLRISQSILEGEEEIATNIRNRNLLVQSMEVERSKVTSGQFDQSDFAINQLNLMSQLQRDLLRLQAELLISLIKREMTEHKITNGALSNPCSLLAQ